MLHYVVQNVVRRNMETQSLNLAQDICPVSEFRANSTSLIKRVREEHRSIILTQHGKSAAVVIDVADFQNMIDELALYKEIKEADLAIDNGHGIAQSKVKKELLAKFK